MVWMVLVLAAVSWLVVALIAEQGKGASLPISSRISSGLLRLRQELPAFGSLVARSIRNALVLFGGAAWAVTRAAGGAASRAFERARSSRRRPAPPGFRVGPSTSRQIATEKAVAGDGWRSRLVALIELILFVVLISALFAGAIAAAAMRIGHLGA
jgi:hypothetical protein